MNNNYQNPFGGFPPPPPPQPSYTPWNKIPDPKPPKDYNPYTDDQSVFTEVYLADPMRFGGPSPMPYEAPQMYENRMRSEKEYVADNAFVKLKACSGYVAMVLLLFLIIREGIGLILSSCQALVSDSTFTLLTLIFTVVQYVGVAAVVIYSMTIGKKNKFYAYMKKPQVSIWFILKWSLIGFGFTHIVAVGSDIFFQILEQTGLHINDLTSPLPRGFAENTLYFIAVVICAPIFEELIFRGILLTPLMRFGNWFAIVTTSVLFGLFHMNHSQLFFPMAFGVILAFMDIRAKSVFPSMIAHAIFNGYSYILGLIASFTNYEEVLENPELELAGNETAVALFGAMNIIAYVIMGAAVVMIILELIINRKQFDLSKGDCSLTVSEKICALITHPIMIVYFVLIVFYIALVSFVDMSAISEALSAFSALLLW